MNNWKLLHGVDLKSAFIGAFLFIIACWLPFAVLSYPGSIPFDTVKQIRQFYGEIPLNASNPLFDTLIFGFWYKVGQTVWDDNFGIFVNVGFQMLLSAVAMARACTWVLKVSGCRKMYLILLAFFAIVPTWGMMVQCVLKDSLHVGFFLLFLVSYLRIVYEKDLCKKDYITLIIHAILVAFSRKAALLIVLLSLTALALYERKHQGKNWRAVLPLVTVAGVYLLANLIVFSTGKVETARQRDNYSLPFQMVARYCQEYGHEMSLEEIEAIDSVLDFDKIREGYTPEIADPVKDTFHSTSSEMGDFWRVFIKLGLKHPEVYLDHLLAGTYKYFYPFSIGTRTYRSYISKNPFHSAHYVIPHLKDLLTNYFQKWETHPILSLLIGPGAYSWLMILLIGYAAEKRSMKSIAAMLPIVILMIGFAVTHINGENRYAYPLIASAPLYYMVIVSQIKSDFMKEACQSEK